MKNNNIIIYLSLTLVLQSCSLISSYNERTKVISFENDYKTIKLKAPSGYCLYDDKKPIEADVIKIVREGNYNTRTQIEFVFQECKEKQSFLSNKNPLFRSTGMIIFSMPDYLKELKKYRIERNRTFYLKVAKETTSSDTTESLNDFVEKTVIPHMKKNNDLEIIDKSSNLQDQQKTELKSVHEQVFGKAKHIFTHYHTKLVEDKAFYDYQEYKIENIITRCIGGDTLVNYAPITLVICEDKKSEDWKELEEKIQKYVNEILKLNDDL